MTISFPFLFLVLMVLWFYDPARSYLHSFYSILFFFSLFFFFPSPFFPSRLPLALPACLSFNFPSRMRYE